MRPALYGAYHHITILGKENAPADYVCDVTGSLCENNDKFAVDRKLPEPEIGDIVVIHDGGAHGHAMGFNYNAKLRCAEFLWEFLTAAAVCFSVFYSEIRAFKWRQTAGLNVIERFRAVTAAKTFI